MNVGNLIASIGVSALLLGIGMNTHRAWNDHGIKEASLSQFVEGQGTTSNSTSSQCTERGGKELPLKVLQLVKYAKETHLNGSVSASGGGAGIVIKEGHKCECKTPPLIYLGVWGCNLSWERVID